MIDQYYILQNVLDSLLISGQFMRANLVVNTDILEIFTGPGFNSISPHTNKKHLSDDFILYILHLFVFGILELFNVRKVLPVRIFAIFTFSFFIHFCNLLARHGFQNCHMFMFVSF